MNRYKIVAVFENGKKEIEEHEKKRRFVESLEGFYDLWKKQRDYRLEDGEITRLKSYVGFYRDGSVFCKETDGSPMLLSIADMFKDKDTDTDPNNMFV